MMAYMSMVFATQVFGVHHLHFMTPAIGTLGEAKWWL